MVQWMDSQDGMFLTWNACVDMAMMPNTSKGILHSALVSIS